MSCAEVGGRRSDVAMTPPPRSLKNAGVASQVEGWRKGRGGGVPDVCTDRQTDRQTDTHTHTHTRAHTSRCHDSFDPAGTRVKLSFGVIRSLNFF